MVKNLFGFVILSILFMAEGNALETKLRDITTWPYKEILPAAGSEVLSVLTKEAIRHKTRPLCATKEGVAVGKLLEAPPTPLQENGQGPQTKPQSTAVNKVTQGSSAAAAKSSAAAAKSSAASAKSSAASAKSTSSAATSTAAGGGVLQGAIPIGTTAELPAESRSEFDLIVKSVLGSPKSEVQKHFPTLMNYENARVGLILSLEISSGEKELIKEMGLKKCDIMEISNLIDNLIDLEDPVTVWSNNTKSVLKSLFSNLEPQVSQDLQKIVEGIMNRVNTKFNTLKNDIKIMNEFLNNDKCYEYLNGLYQCTELHEMFKIGTEEEWRAKWKAHPMRDAFYFKNYFVNLVNQMNKGGANCPFDKTKGASSEFLKQIKICEDMKNDAENILRLVNDDFRKIRVAYRVIFKAKQ